MKNILNYLIKSILAGVLIGIGGSIYLSCTNKIVGSFLFAIGLFTIVCNGYNLYTGKIGYLLDNKPKYLIELLITLIGNFMGTFFVGFVLRFTRVANSIVPLAQSMSEIKLNDSFVSLLILAFFCGILMYLAVNGYKTIENTFGKVLIVFLGVMVFILCGFEHCIANMFYFSLANVWSWHTLLCLLIMILGNSLGGLFFPFMTKIMAKKS